jgi:hypothetical protein
MSNDELRFEILSMNNRLRKAKEAVRRMVSDSGIERADAFGFTPETIEGLNLQDGVRALAELMDMCLAEVEAL